jgi:hypothetical protein
MKLGQSMQSFISDVHRVEHQLKDIGVKVKEEETILVLTGGVPPSYNHLIVALDSTPEDKFSIEFIINRLLNEEAVRNCISAEAFLGISRL